MGVPRDLTRLLSYYGSNTLHARTPGQLLADCKWVGIPFCGGLNEVPYFYNASTILCNDTNKLAINLYRVLQYAGDRLREDLSVTPYHPDVLAEAQRMCKSGREGYDVAKAYLVCSWMSRSAKTGTMSELSGSITVRYGGKGSGGGCNQRFRTVIEALRDWQKVVCKCEFLCEDVFDFLSKPIDRSGNGLYVDPPWPKDGDCYKQPFFQHERLFEVLNGYTQTKIVVRYGDDPLTKRLYSRWRPIEFTSREQNNELITEYLYVKEN